MHKGCTWLHGLLIGLLTLVTAVGCTAPAQLRASPLLLAQAPAPMPSDAPPATVAPSPISNLYVHLPIGAELRQPLSVLLVLHGMGGNGPDMARDLIPEANRNGWVIVAPTIEYRDWRDPEQVRRDGADVLPALKALLLGLPDRTGLALERRALVYGFSRGGQTAQRLALFYPDLVDHVATFSCGTYTLPAERVRRGAEEVPLEFPYGVGDLTRYDGQPFDADGVRRVSFWLGVGGSDNLPSDVPRQWDPYLGTNRVERAQAFARALDQLGAPTNLTIFPGAAHEISPEMRAQALAFLAAPTG